MCHGRIRESFIRTSGERMPGIRRFGYWNPSGGYRMLECLLWRGAEVEW